MKMQSKPIRHLAARVPTIDSDILERMKTWDAFHCQKAGLADEDLAQPCHGK